MNTQELHNEFQTELVRRGLPVEYSSGAAAELADHHRDVVEELRANGFDASTAENEAANRLGDRRQLVKKSVREFQRRHWCGRWPLLTFFIGPIPLLILTWVATSAACFLILWPMQRLGIIADHQPDGIISWDERMLVYAFRFWFFFVTPALVTIALGRSTVRAAMNFTWMYFSAILLALFVGSFIFDLNEKGFQVSMPIDQGLLILGLPLFEASWAAAWQWYVQDPLYLCQSLLPLGVAVVFMLYSKQLSFRTRCQALDAC